MALISGHKWSEGVIVDSDGYEVVRIAGGAPGLDPGDKMESGTVRDTDGYKKVRIATGSSGGVGVELGYAQITTDFGGIGGSDTDVTGLSATVTGVNRPVVVFAYTGGMYATVAAQKEFAVFDGATLLSRSRTYQATASGDNQMLVQARVAAFTGSKTFKVVASTSAGAAAVRAAAVGTSPGPAFIQVFAI